MAEKPKKKKKTPAPAGNPKSNAPKGMDFSKLKTRCPVCGHLTIEQRRKNMRSE